MRFPPTPTGIVNYAFLPGVLYRTPNFGRLTGVERGKTGSAARASAKAGGQPKGGNGGRFNPFGETKGN